METRSILVVTDLSLSGRCALNHALAVAQATGAHLHLLYTVRRNREVPRGKVALYALAEEAKLQHANQVARHIRVGPGWIATAQLAEEVEADLIVMGSNLVAGLPKLFGHPALKLFDRCCRPFVVVQDREALGEFRRIVLPVEPDPDFNRQLQVTAALAASCQSRVFLLARRCQKIASQRLLQEKIELGTRFLRRKGIAAQLAFASGKQDFAQEVLSYAQEVAADLITVRHLPEQRYWFRGFEPQILTNAQQIPALVVSPLAK